MTGIVNKDIRYKRVLEKLYPDKNVLALQEKHKSLYQEIRLYSEEKGLRVKDYIIGLGFEYTRKNQVRYYSEEELIPELQHLFPDKIFGDLKQIQDKNNDLFNSLKSISKKNKLGTYEYLFELGYVQKSDSVGESNIIYDTISLLKLRNEYNFNASKLANWLSVSKQNLDHKMSRKRDFYPYWQEKELNIDDLKIINSMIDDKATFYEDSENNTIFNIYKNNVQQDCAILIIKGEEVKCIFSIPQDLKAKLLNSGFHKYDSRDFEIQKELNNNSDLLNIDDTGIIEIKISNKSLDKRITSILQSRKDTDYGSNKSKYLEFLGFKTSRYKITDDEIHTILLKYRDAETNNIHIPADDAEYDRINNLAHRRGYKGIKDFIESYGYNYYRVRVTNYIEKVTERIKQYYIVDENRIYINSTDPLYAGLTQYAMKNNMKLDELLSSIGFIRVKNNDLPEGYRQFDWAKQEKIQIKDMQIGEGLITLLDERIIQGNQIYISSYEPLYDRLFLYSHRNGSTIDEFLKSLGYARIFLRDMPSESREFHWIQDKSDESDIFSQKMLSEIRSIQGDLETSKTIKEKVLRSSNLVKAMKKLYNFRCQLCCPDDTDFSSPIIEKDDGTLYVEAHHITAISERDAVDDDSRKAIDTYENVVVVCTHHHKFLHYHRGGFSEIVKDKAGILYFRSNNGELAIVYTDHHLKFRKNIKLLNY